MKTFSAKPAEVKRQWYVIDAEGKTLGRLVVINAAKVAVTGKKASDKMYHHHTGYIGNLKSVSFEKMQERSPGRPIQLAVKGMLPKNALGRAMIKKLKIFPGPEHLHAAQTPEPLEIK